MGLLAYFSRSSTASPRSVVSARTRTQSRSTYLSYFIIPKTIDGVIIHHARRLHVRDGDGWQKAWRAAHGSLKTFEFLQGSITSPQPEPLILTFPQVNVLYSAKHTPAAGAVLPQKRPALRPAVGA